MQAVNAKPKPSTTAKREKRPEKDDPNMAALLANNPTL